MARDTFIRLLANDVESISYDLRFVTQAADSDASIPDLVGLANDRPVIICEAKFWAGLTDHQPVTYIQRLQKYGGGVLVFIVPAMRFSTLHSELLRRCKTANLSPKETAKTKDAELKVTQIERHVPLVICSWRLVLDTMKYKLDEMGEYETAADVRQLAGLCDQMDSEAFLPLRSEELSCAIGSRIIQFTELVDKVTDALIREGVASKENLKASWSGGYGQYMIICGFGCRLHINFWYWSKHRETPLWLSIQRKDWSFSPEAQQALSIFANENPPRSIPYKDVLLVPIFLPIAKVETDVLAAIRSQLDEVIEALKDAKHD